MFKKIDYIIISVICFFLGVFVISQYYAGKEYRKVIQPENNATLAIEVAKLTKANAELRTEVQGLTGDLDNYKNATVSGKNAFDQYTQDLARLDVINGLKSKTGQGIVIKIDGNLSTAEIVDLVNAIKNIGGEMITINNERLVLNASLGRYSNRPDYEIKVIGNSSLLKTSMERKGGIIDQISGKNIRFSILESDNIEIASGNVIEFNYAKVVK